MSQRYRTLEEIGKEMAVQRYLVFDYETRSACDLKKCGAFEYSVHPTTQILCAAWVYGTKEEIKDAEPKIWSPAFIPVADEFGGLIKALLNPDVILVAHNAYFEQVITRNVLSKLMSSKPYLKEIPHERWICTAARAAALALPRKLEGACRVLGLPVQKDMEGAKLLLKYCKPRKPTKNNPARWHKKASELRRIMQYCATDVKAEVGLFLKTPPLNSLETEIWNLDQKINFRGTRCDLSLVNRALTMVEVETENLNKETRELTHGRINSATQRNAILEEVRRHGNMLPDLRAKTVQDALGAGLVSGTAQRLLEIRQAVSKSSTAKYVAFKERSKHDGRVRDLLLYWGASTGRWAGMGIQPQNFPRGTIKETDLAADLIKTGCLESVRLIFGNPMNVLSSCLRGAFIASEGKEFFCADYAAIEARVLFWVAGHEDGITAFREGRDLYKEMAAHIFKKKAHQIEKGGYERQVGKQAILGCGYGMGASKFRATCDNYSIEVSEELASAAVKAYRDTHSLVPTLWGNLDRAAIAAVRNPGKKYSINKTSWWVEDNFLWCELPSGRRLAYFNPSVKFKDTPWGDKKPTLYFWSQNSMTRQWENSGTWGGVLTENVVQAIARDLMAESMLRIENAGYNICLSIHDELLAERTLGEGSLKEFTTLMAQNPGWAKGCPVQVEGWQGLRYRK